ncbi:MAG: DUF2254 family protein [Gammaproteobacteria bacterium]
MSRRMADNRRVVYLGFFGAFVTLTLVTWLVFSLSSLIEGVGLRVFTDPAGWLADLDQGVAAGILSGSAQVVAGLLSIAITVSAIVVELAASRYNHRITLLFVREPFNVAVWSLFVVTTILCVWVAATREPGVISNQPNAAFAVTMVLVTICLLLLLPYFAFVFAFLSPLSVIDKVKRRAYGFIKQAARTPGDAVKNGVQDAIDELQDVARSASEQSDRGIAMACVDALKDLVVDYQSIRGELPEAWFSVDGPVAEDPDFVSMADSVLEDVEKERLWLEVKVFRQYLSLMLQCVPQAREVANLIAINTGRIGAAHGAANRALLELCIRCFNSYLRCSINAADARTSYYVMNQYRLFAESLMAQGLDEPVRAVASHFKFYGQAAHERGQSFLLQTAVGDLSSLVEASLARGGGTLTDDLLAVVLEVDQEICNETHEESLLGVRKAQLQLATLFALRGDEARARRICRDLAGERLTRLERLRRELEGESRPQYWEFTDRGANFAYISADRRAQLPLVMDWIKGYAGAGRTP